MKYPSFFSVASGICLLAAHTVLAGDIINDSFFGAKGAAISGRAPDKANLPGGKWSVVAMNTGGGFQAVIDAGTGNLPPRAYLACGGNSTGAIAIPLAGAGAKAQRFTISADLLGANPSLGFYSALPVQDAAGAADVFQNFTGLQLGGSGDLALYRKGGLVATVKYTGSFDPKAFHNLSYDVDVRSGSISNVKLQGSMSDYSAFTIPGAFTDAATAYAAIAVLCEGGRDNLTYADNFVVTAGGAASAPAPAAVPVVEKQNVAPPSILIHSGDRIGFMGDSITALGNSRKGYVQLVIAGLKEEGVYATAIPAGHSGDTSGNMVHRTNFDVLHKGADWMTISCGVNDVAAPEKEPGAALEAFKKNVAGMVAKAQGWNVRVLLLTATPRGENLTGEYNPKLASYNEFLRSFAKEKALPLADVNAVFCDYLGKPSADTHEVPGKRLLADGLHPNDAGQFLMALTVLEAMGVPKADMPRVEKALRDSIKQASGAGN